MADGLFDLPTSHADHMLIAYLPRSRLLMQADLINQGDYPANRHGRQLLNWIKARRLAVEEIAGVHGATVRTDQFAETATLEAPGPCC